MADGLEVRMNTDKLDELIQMTPIRADKFLRYVAQQIVDDIKLSFDDSPPGEVYFRGPVAHVASMPGYPPTVDTGALRASMHWEKRGELEYIVSDGVEYGQYLELLMDRAFVTPIFEEWRDRFGDEMNRFGVVE